MRARRSEAKVHSAPTVAARLASSMGRYGLPDEAQVTRRWGTASLAHRTRCEGSRPLDGIGSLRSPQGHRGALQAGQQEVDPAHGLRGLRVFHHFQAMTCRIA